MTSIVRLPFGRAGDGRMVSVDAVMRGLKCECVCPQCSSALIAVQGEIRAHHFRHHVEPAAKDCYGAPETALHKFAKQVIGEAIGIGFDVPEHVHLPVGYLDDMVMAKIEFSISKDLRPDVYATFGTKDGPVDVAIEIFVAHACTDEKIVLYNDRKIAACEIDLRAYRFAERGSEASWREAILSTAPRRWLSPPAIVRDALERERAAFIEAKKAAEKAAEEKKLAAEAARLAALAALRAAEAEQRKREDELNEFMSRTAPLDEAARQERQRIEQAVTEQRRQSRLSYERYLAEQAAEKKRIAELERAQAIADAAAKRAKDADIRAAIREKLRREKYGPDLQALVAAAGGYDKITPEQWVAHDDELRRWALRTRLGDFHLHPYNAV